MATASERMRADVTALLKARSTLLWIVTREEARVERALIEASIAAKYDVRLWDVAAGLTEADGAVINAGQGQDPAWVCNAIRDNKSRSVFILRDLHKWLADPTVLRRVRSLARSLESAPPERATSVVILTPSSEVPPELAGHAIVLDWPLPEREEVAAILDQLVAAQDGKIPAPENGERDVCIDAAIGLTAQEIANCYARSVVTKKRIDPALVSSEKRRTISREKVLTWFDPDPRGLDAVGGYGLLKSWLVRKRRALSQKARAFGCDPPKGVLLVGPPGTGKSLTAKAVAAAWGVPLLRIDLGALKSKWVGESEANLRRALQTAEAVSPCVLWLDEGEKALAGSTGPQGDGGVASDALGAILTWMQERTGSVFVVVTANDVATLPPAFLRKGRFDGMFFIDLPQAGEREEIWRTTLARYGRDPEALGINFGVLVAATETFTGAEIASCVPDALLLCFDEGERDLTTADLLVAARAVVPMASVSAEELQELRAWAQKRAMLASAPERQEGTGTRVLDLSDETN